MKPNHRDVDDRVPYFDETLDIQDDGEYRCQVARMLYSLRQWSNESIDYEAIITFTDVISIDFMFRFSLPVKQTKFFAVISAIILLTRLFFVYMDQKPNCLSIGNLLFCTLSNVPFKGAGVEQLASTI
jgi:hypothetical protein